MPLFVIVELLAINALTEAPDAEIFPVLVDVPAPLAKIPVDLSAVIVISAAVVIGLTVYIWNWKFESLKRTSIDGYVKVPFEDTEFYAPQGYIEYLENTFGDYMTPPPEDRRVSHHNFNVYWKNK